LLCSADLRGTEKRFCAKLACGGQHVPLLSVAVTHIMLVAEAPFLRSRRRCGLEPFQEAHGFRQAPCGCIHKGKSINLPRKLLPKILPSKEDTFDIKMRAHVRFAQKDCAKRKKSNEHGNEFFVSHVCAFF
jgi:hypothetical protein